MAIDKGLSKTELTSQTIDNYDFDKQYGISRKAQYVYNPATDSFEAVDVTGKVMKTKITTSGDITYVAKAPVGTAESEDKWQAKKVEVSGSDTTITWADSGKFTQVATDLTALTYA